MNIAIVGAGIAGLSAAYDLLASGNQVALYEAGKHTGGLAAGFKDDSWEWPLERYYHHLFTSDKHIIQFVKALGIEEQLFFPRPVTSILFHDRIYPFDSPKAWITYPGFNMVNVARFGLVSAYLRFTSPWRSLESFTADAGLRRWYGSNIYDMVWRPLLIGKFGPYFQDANMAWMWARLKVRSPKLGYFIGGFQTFVDALTSAVEQRGGKIWLNSPVRAIQTVNTDEISITVGDETVLFDRVLVTTSPYQLLGMVPEIAGDYRKKLVELKSMGAVVLVLALKKQLMPTTYWLNLPAASPDKTTSDYPFLALVEHTNYISSSHYGGDHLVYCGDYVVPDHLYFDLEKSEIEQRYLGVLNRFNPDFDPSWVRKSWLFRTRYAQPVPEVNHSYRLPDIQTPLPNLLFASMSQVYPWDRGTNFAVEMGRRAARVMAKTELTAAQILP